MPIAADKIRLILSLLAVFLIPGWSFISITGLWRTWRPLQRWIVAIAASLAFYPILYYAARAIFPSIHIGFYKNLALLGLGIVTILVTLRKNWREQFAFDRWEAYALVIFGLTIFTRFWIIRDLPYPAWSDSLHHTLLTQLTAEFGRLPYTLEPYSGTSLDMYHLGLYAITGVVQQLSGEPAYTALLWSAQLINGLCAMGIYFVLDRFVGKRAALAGIVVAGLISFQPAWYVNWGRFTQLASQVIMLVALGVTWHALRNITKPNPDTSKLQSISLIILSAGLNAAIFLLHFRVAAYYLPLLVAIVIYELISAAKKRRLQVFITTIGPIGAGSLLLVLPALILAMKVYFGHVYQGVLLEQVEANFGYSTQTIISVGIQPWLFWIAIISGVFALLTRHRALAIITWSWIIILFLEGNLYRLGISALRFTNLSGVIIGFYLPVALLIGLAIEALLERIPQNWQERSAKIFAYSFLMLGILGSYNRSTGIEPWRFFMTEDDRQAMDWINANTPSEATFAINTYIWLGTYPHGTDGGYWIPYFTGRRTNTETMLLPINQPDEMKSIQERSQAIVNYISGNAGLKSLCENGLDFIYSGKNGNAMSKAFDTHSLLLDPLAKLVYQNPGVMIFQLCLANAAQ